MMLPRTSMGALCCTNALSGIDGLPNVLLEAQSQGLACLATDVSGIPELIEHGITGLLVAPGDGIGLSNALARLIGDPQLRKRLGEAGKHHVSERFCFKTGIDRLTVNLQLALQGAHP